MIQGGEDKPTVSFFTPAVPAGEVWGEQEISSKPASRIRESKFRIDFFLMGMILVQEKNNASKSQLQMLKSGHKDQNF